MRILIVEDEQVLSHQIRDFFLTKGFVVDIAYTGSEGAYLAAEYPIDIGL